MYIFHDHLDGGLLPNTLLEMAINTSYEPIMNLTEAEVRKLMNKSNSNSFNPLSLNAPPSRKVLNTRKSAAKL